MTRARTNRSDISLPGLARGVVIMVGALLLIDASDATAPVRMSEAVAGRTGAPMPPNAAVQRRDMLDKLDSLDRRMKKIEERLAKPLEVKVLDMPDVVVKGE
ncbi:MAG: hypothetical protein AAGD00_10045 [Planctomycetota bacterium]